MHNFLILIIPLPVLNCSSVNNKHSKPNFKLGAIFVVCFSNSNCAFSSASSLQEKGWRTWDAEKCASGERPESLSQTQTFALWENENQKEREREMCSQIWRGLTGLLLQKRLNLKAFLSGLYDAERAGAAIIERNSTAIANQFSKRNYAVERIEGPTSLQEREGEKRAQSKEQQQNITSSNSKQLTTSNSQASQTESSRRQWKPHRMKKKKFRASVRTFLHLRLCRLRHRRHWRWKRRSQQGHLQRWKVAFARWTWKRPSDCWASRRGAPGRG